MLKQFLQKCYKQSAALKAHLHFQSVVCLPSCGQRENDSPNDAPNLHSFIVCDILKLYPVIRLR